MKSQKELGVMKYNELLAYAKKHTDVTKLSDLKKQTLINALTGALPAGVDSVVTRRAKVN